MPNSSTILLTGANETQPCPRALRLRGARITGILNLEAVQLVCPLVLQDCSFEGAINLKEAQAPAVRLPGCHLPGLDANQLVTRGNLDLDQGFTANGAVNLGSSLNRVGGVSVRR